jgi:hypothetical protein
MPLTQTAYPDWIPVSMPPVIYEPVLLFFPTLGSIQGGQEIGYMVEGGSWRVTDRGEPIFPPTHWMPLPPDPKR